MSEHIIKGADWAICHNGDSLFKGAEEIVRCRDCEFAAYEGTECMRVYEWDDSLWFPVEPDGFCACGRRDS